ncbi:MAG: hypothetical protein GXY33_19915 [Phycisphaerae bacterium]|nr:hypothetical protein [Phycisphaerae bacterium]
MNEIMRQVLERTMRVFEKDPRVLAAYASGSMGTSDEDRWSDVDPMLVIRAEEFAAFDADLRGLFEQAGVQPILWWPERINCDTYKNYAVLFESDGRLSQYDINFLAAPREPVRVEPAKVIFDKAGILQAPPASNEPAYRPDRLVWTVEIYWIYAYIHAKYLRRRGPFHLIAAQHELFQAHLEILRALRGDIGPDWWPIVARRIHRDGGGQILLDYLRHVDAPAIARALPGQLAQFSRDARAACEKWSVPYPEMLAGKIAADLQKAIDEIIQETAR